MTQPAPSAVVDQDILACSPCPGDDDKDGPSASRAGGGTPLGTLLAAICVPLAACATGIGAGFFLMWRRSRSRGYGPFAITAEAELVDVPTANVLAADSARGSYSKACSAVSALAVPVKDTASLL